MSVSMKNVEQSFALAKERYAALGVDVDRALERLARDFDLAPLLAGRRCRRVREDRQRLGGGLAVTGNHPGKARTPDELRADLDKALSLIPGKHRLNLHACYRDTPKKVARNELVPEHFQRGSTGPKSGGWASISTRVTFLIQRPRTGSPSLIATRPSANSGSSTASPAGGSAPLSARRSARPASRISGFPTATKTRPIGRGAPAAPRFARQDFCGTARTRHNLDAVEAKLFGIGSESYVVGSHEFYLGYAISRKKLVCLDAGHFHPTETSPTRFPRCWRRLDEILLHVSRGVRWDSDHMVTLTDDLQAIAQEIVRGGFLGRVHLGLDFFDASINRVAAWVIGTQLMLKALLLALLEPIDRLRMLEAEGDYTSRLALLEELKTLPCGAVWDHYCLKSDVPIGREWIDEVKRYERDVLARRGQERAGEIGT